MTQFKTLVSAIALIAIVIGMSSCDENMPNIPSSNNDFSSDLFAMVIPDFESSGIYEASIDTPMNMRPPDRPMPNFFPMGRILSQLNLTDEQKEQIREFMLEHRECVHTNMMLLRESEREIIENANQLRRGIIESMRAGDITREQAREQIMMLNQETRALLASNPIRQQILEAIELCKSILKENIESVLTEEQLELWVDFWENIEIERGHRGGRK